MYETDQKPSMMKPIIVGGLIAGVVSLIPGITLLNCACCLPFIIGSVVAVLIYSTSSYQGITSGKGAVIGLFVGLVGGAIALIGMTGWGIFVASSMERFEKFIESVIEMLESGGSGAYGPSLTEPAVQMYQEMTPEMLIPLILVVMIIFMLIGTIFSLLGGLITAAIVGKRDHYEGDMPPPYEPS